MPRIRKIKPLYLEASGKCGYFLVALAPCDIGYFRFYLEAYENLALFRVIDTKKALLKVFFAQEQEKLVLEALKEIGISLTLQILPWPKSVKS